MRYSHRIYLCIIKDHSSEWDSQISLFVVFNNIIIIFLGRERMSRISKFALNRIVFYVCTVIVICCFYFAVIVLIVNLICLKL